MPIVERLQAIFTDKDAEKCRQFKKMVKPLPVQQVVRTLVFEWMDKQNKKRSNNAKPEILPGK